MRQLGRYDLEQQVGGTRPGEQESRRGLAMTDDRGGHGRNEEERRRPERRDRQQQIVAGRLAMRFLAAGNLGAEIVPERLLVERAVTLQRDRDEPWQDDQERQNRTPDQV